MEKALSPNDPRVVELAKHDEVIQWMLAKHIPITREAYIESNHIFGEPPKRWTSEHEDELPEILQDWSKVRRTA
jgi:hypothetical protein